MEHIDDINVIENGLLATYEAETLDLERQLINSINELSGDNKITHTNFNFGKAIKFRKSEKPYAKSYGLLELISSKE